MALLNHSMVVLFEGVKAMNNLKANHVSVTLCPSCKGNGFLESITGQRIACLLCCGDGFVLFKRLKR
jgi:hypothetical protein